MQYRPSFLPQQRVDTATRCHVFGPDGLRCGPQCCPLSYVITSSLPLTTSTQLTPSHRSLSHTPFPSIPTPSPMPALHHCLRTAPTPFTNPTLVSLPGVYIHTSPIQYVIACTIHVWYASMNESQISALPELAPPNRLTPRSGSGEPLVTTQGLPRL